MAFEGIRALTFDVVGTLIDFETGIVDHVRSVQGASAPQVSDDAILDAFGRAEGEQQRRAPELSFTQMLAPIRRRLAAELGLPEGAGADLAASVPHWPAFPDAVAALRELRRHFRLVAVTNADRWALGHMATALGDPFDDAVTAEDVGVSKPDPRVFAYALGRQSVHGYPRADHLHVAQSRFHDIGIAGRLGLRTCWIERRHGRPGSGATPAPTEAGPPDLHFHSMAALARAVRDERGEPGGPGPGVRANG